MQPFGEGMMTTQLRRGENSLLLWSLSDLSNPVHSFFGNNDLVLEFDWKSPRSGMTQVSDLKKKTSIYSFCISA